MRIIAIIMFIIFLCSFIAWIILRVRIKKVKTKLEVLELINPTDDRSNRVVYGDEEKNEQEGNNTITINEEFFTSLGNVFVIVLSDKPFIPAIDNRGYIQVLSDEKYIQIDEYKQLSVAKMTGEDIWNNRDRWASMGIVKMKVQVGEKVFILGDLKLPDYYNSDISNFIIKMMSRGLVDDVESDDYKMNTAYLIELMKNNVFIVPANYEGESLDPPFDDNEMHVFPGASKKIAELIEKGMDFKFDGYPFAQTPSSNRKLTVRTTMNSKMGKEFFAIFTNLEEFLPIWKGNARYALVSAEDIIELKDDQYNVIINPLSIAFELNQEVMSRFEGTVKQNKEQQPS